ncbi:MAG: hypothetical protein OXH68_12145 [Gammaproteobacteria bacterium]|nr:hypothetical protein [Gammaproteobacteria bacterium]
MRRFYRIQDRTLFARGMPWIAEFTQGLAYASGCEVCRSGHSYRAVGDMCARLDPKRGTQWPDLIGSGARVGVFVASGRFVRALRAEGVRVRLGGRVNFAEQAPKRLSLTDAPDYHWVDGEGHRAAKMDFEASGYVGVERCAACGRWWEDIKASRTRDFPVVFEYDASSGEDLFTTDMSRLVFYCTHRVLECVKANRLTNVAFRPVEEGRFAKPVRYWQ